MIEILPMQDREAEKKLLAQVKGGVSGEARILTMRERGETLGWVAVELAEGTLRILQLTASDYDFSRKPQGEEVFILDSLMRSAASYGENYGANKIETAFPDFYSFFAVRGFSFDENHAFAPMSTIVRYEFH